MAEDDVYLVVFVGEYIYESSWGDHLVCRHVASAACTLADHRNRYVQYRTDPDLQRRHALVPWLMTWDDYEVDNDYANDQFEHLDPQFLLRRAASYQAYRKPMLLWQARFRMNCRSSAVTSWRC